MVRPESPKTTSGPKSWDTIQDLKVPLERILFAHSEAGLLWERHLEVLFVNGWDKVPNWEYLFMHREKGECMPNSKVVQETKNLFELISEGTVKQLRDWEISHVDMLAWSYEMEALTKTCVERYCEIANMKIEH